MSRTVTSALALSVATLMVPAAARAAVISYTDSFSVSTGAAASGAGGSDSDTASDALSFAQFDPTLGALNNVTFALEDVAAGVTSAFSIGGAEGASGAAAAQASFSIVAPAGTPVTLAVFDEIGSATSACSYPIDATPGCSDGPPGTVVSPVFPASALLDQAINLPPYVGLGALQVDALLNLDVSIGTCVFDGGIFDMFCTTDGSASWNGTLRLTYDYTPFPTGPGGDVPVPATLLLLGTGLAGLGAARRRR